MTELAKIELIVHHQKGAEVDPNPEYTGGSNSVIMAQEKEESSMSSSAKFGIQSVN